MSGFKDPSYLDRKGAATDAKKAALEKFRARLSGNDPVADVAAKPAKPAPPVGKTPEAKGAKTQSPKATSPKPKATETKPTKPKSK